MLNEFRYRRQHWTLFVGAKRVMTTVWNILFSTFDFVCIILLHFTDSAVPVLTEGLGPIYGLLLVTAVAKLWLTASSSPCFDQSITKLRPYSHILRWNIGINITICWRHGPGYCLRSWVNIRIVDRSCQKTGSNHCVFFMESFFGYDNNKMRDFVVPKVNPFWCVQIDLRRTLLFWIQINWFGLSLFCESFWRMWIT